MRKLRDYHNHVKYELCKELIPNRDNDLLDIGVGRGGDMHKWHKCEIQNVYGIDISKGSILDAISRFKGCEYLKHRKYRFYYTRKKESFQNIYDAKIKPCKYDRFKYISCMFAFHYFFENENSLNQFFCDINNFIQSNGILMLTVPDGDAIMKLLQNKQTFQNSCMRIDLNSRDIRGIGDEIDFYLTDTLYFGDKFVSKEFLVFENILKQKCQKYNFKIIKNCMFHDYIPPLLHDDEKTASSINRIYVLQKSSSVCNNVL